MPKLTIDGQSAEVPEGATILDVAQTIGIHIPTLCYIREMSPLTSCMVCVVKVEGSRSLLPSCATVVRDGMVVISEDPEVLAARRTALELLLSDHVGDCMGPCQIACPAGMDIPEMLRNIATGNHDKAIEVVKEHIALPAVTGRICPAPCEKACRRGMVDEPVPICLLKRYAADVDLTGSAPYTPAESPNRDNQVAIIGAGPAGLATAYYLQRDGFSCTVMDDQKAPGGMLRYGISDKDLPRSVLDAEIEQIRRLGVVFQQQIRLGRDLMLPQVLERFDAVFLGLGKVPPEDLKALGFESKSGTLRVDPKTYQTDMPGVFAGGGLRRELKMAARSLGDGREAAFCISRFLTGESIIGSVRPFNTRMGRPDPEALTQMAGTVNVNDRKKPLDRGAGLTEDEARFEATRCMHCDCRKSSSCKLRIHAQTYGAKATSYPGKRRTFIRWEDHPDLVYEPGKCISCGICVQTTEQHREQLGMTFIGRGFDVRVAVPFNQSLKTGLFLAAQKAVTSCPTGALAFK